MRLLADGREETVTVKEGWTCRTMGGMDALEETTHVGAGSEVRNGGLKIQESERFH